MVNPLIFCFNLHVSLSPTEIVTVPTWPTDASGCHFRAELPAAEVMHSMCHYLSKQRARNISFP